MQITKYLIYGVTWSNFLTEQTNSCSGMKWTADNFNRISQQDWNGHNSRALKSEFKLIYKIVMTKIKATINMAADQQRGQSRQCVQGSDSRLLLHGMAQVDLALGIYLQSGLWFTFATYEVTI